MIDLENEDELEDDESEEDEDEDYGFSYLKPKSPNTPNSGKEIYLLYLGIETGSREDCSIFYEVPEVWEDKANAKARQKALDTANKGNPDFYTYLVPVKIK